MEALLIQLPRRTEAQPYTYLCAELPLGPHFSWHRPAEPYEPTNRNRNAAYSQHLVYFDHLHFIAANFDRLTIYQSGFTEFRLLAAVRIRTASTKSFGS
jgi:hypothetical protein